MAELRAPACAGTGTADALFCARPADSVCHGADAWPGGRGDEWAEDAEPGDFRNSGAEAASTRGKREDTPQPPRARSRAAEAGNKPESAACNSGARAFERLGLRAAGS